MSTPTLSSIEFGPTALNVPKRVEGQAELIAGRIYAPVGRGHTPTRVAFKIAMRLEADSERTGNRVAYCNGIGFACMPPLSNGCQSFSPGTSYYAGPLPANEMRYIEGSLLFVVAVRSENDQGSALEEAKRADPFEAGTRLVWDVDPDPRTSAAPADGNPTTSTHRYRPGETADAEPVLPGWRLALTDIFC